MGPKTKLSQWLHGSKYRGQGESFDEYVERVSDTLSDSDDHFFALQEILGEQRFLPAGRIQSAVGSPRVVTAFNCFVSDTIDDSMEGIMDAAKNAALTMKKGGGIGYEINDKMTVDLGYRYFATADPDFNGLDAEYGSHNVTIGIRFGL